MAGCGCGCGCGCVVVTGCVVVPGCVVVALSLWLWRYRCSCVAHVRACMCGAQAIPGVASSHRVLHLLLSLPTLPLSKSPLTWRTPLHYAAQRGRSDLVRYMLAKGADIFAADHQVCEWLSTYDGVACTHSL